ncbi:MAG TPA: RDD family protein [Bdellovibrionota bacterium]|nr:RDD family protein [Bdellovibrionota bacterium]
MDQETRDISTPASRKILNPSKGPRIEFTPLSDGLGFHPFADGLPYAPVTRAQGSAKPLAAALNPMGTGAVAAGRPMPVPPGRSPILAPRVPVAAAAAAAARAPLVGGIPVAGTAYSQAAFGQPARAAPETAPAAAPQHFGFLYLIKRTFAFFVDAAINTTLCVLALGGVAIRLDMNWDSLANANLMFLSVLFLIMFNWAVVTAQEVVLGTTLGKRMFGLVLRGETSAIFLRAFFFLPSLVFGGLGIVWAVFDRRKRCWHDHAVDVQPIELAEL